MAAAVLCGIFGLGAYAFRTYPLSLAGYLLAYLAGSWFTAQEVWERLQKRAIDVHFLMLFVAGVAAYLNAWGEGATLLFLFSLSGALEHCREVAHDHPPATLDERNEGARDENLHVPRWATRAYA